ncbi:putative ribonuclease H-like domain-containing protein [Tanacetum coccineum]
MIKNKTRLVAQGYTQEEGIDYDEVFAPVARIEAIRLFLAYASFKDFVVYQMDVKSAFLYGKIEEEVYVCQQPGFEDPNFPNRVYKVEKALYGLHQAPKAWYETLSTYLLENRFQRGQIDKTLFIKRDQGDILIVQKEYGIFISQDKYVTEILKKFSFSDVKTANTPMETHKPLLKDADGEDVGKHMYRSMIGSLMYLTSSRPDIMFVVCVCARFHVNPKVSHLYVVKRLSGYPKGQPKLGLWYPKDLPFDLVAYTNNDYTGESLDRKSTIGDCQFLGCRLISWQCKKQTVVANSTIEAKYVAASSCCGQVLWIQNQLLDYGYNFMHTKIYIDNESTICIVKNPIFHSKIKHIEIRHHFIRDYNEKKLI